MDCCHQTIFIFVRSIKRKIKIVKRTGKLWKKNNWAHRRSQAKCQLVETSYIERIKLFLFLLYNKHLISRAEWCPMGAIAKSTSVFLFLCFLYIFFVSIDLIR